MSARIFISYQRFSSSALANLLLEKLQDRGFSVFLDTARRDNAGEFPRHLLQEIEKCDVFLCVLGEKTLESTWVINEIEHAVKCGKILIPVLQERFQTPATMPNASVNTLLNSQGVPILDVRGIYFDAGATHIVELIEASVPQEVTASVEPPSPMSSKFFAFVNPSRISIGIVIILLLVAVGILVSRSGMFIIATLPTPTSTENPTDTPTNTPTPTDKPTATLSPTETPTAVMTPADLNAALFRGNVVVITVTEAWVRSEPNSTALPLVTLRHGDSVWVVGESKLDPIYNQIWWPVNARGREGWVEQTSLGEAVPTPTRVSIVVPGFTPFDPPTITTAPLCNYNAACDGGENAQNCPADCGDQGGPGTCDYDAMCEVGESHQSCPADC